ncbi:hypothetical protein D3C75_798280 [compost metagenome]
MLHILRQVFQQRHHYSDGRFIIRAQHAGAIAENDLFVRISQDFRVFGGTQPDIFLWVKTQIIAGKAQHLRVNIR